MILVAPLVCVKLAKLEFPDTFTFPVFVNAAAPVIALVPPAKLTLKPLVSVVIPPLNVTLSPNVTLLPTFVKLTLPALKVLTNVVFVAFAIVTLLRPLVPPTA